MLTTDIIAAHIAHDSMTRRTWSEQEYYETFAGAPALFKAIARFARAIVYLAQHARRAHPVPLPGLDRPSWQA